jgi:hypothetical protein
VTSAAAASLPPSGSLRSTATFSIARLPPRWMPKARATSGGNMVVDCALKCTT